MFTWETDSRSGPSTSLTTSARLVGLGRSPVRCVTTDLTYARSGASQVETRHRERFQVARLLRARWLAAGNDT
jgi:hypothetical protein